ncbi:hypothetical protein PoB_004947800 [Plakobranchus ocellatus]|uniref:MADF domain-containing protein n=1 Tax=Plakobranchus ocellatus TaxID=259542 RepID=A0AAV4BTN6_9GAST|nr:hypothetical protein PoB_004947800 [Plakobranchus ocellatus]
MSDSSRQLARLSLDLDLGIKLSQQTRHKIMDTDKPFEFISLIQDYPSLWIKQDKNFMNREVRRNNFQEIAQKMNMTVVTSPVDPSSTLDGPLCLAPFLSYPLLAASEQPATIHCFCAAFGENASVNVEQCTSHQRADSYWTASSYSFWCEHFEPTARNCSKRLAQLIRGYCAATAFGENRPLC